MSLPPGTPLGPYEILEPIGAGGMGEVYRAMDPRLGRAVAIKVLHPAFASDASQLKRFEQEARIVARLNHPNILHVYDTGVHAGAPYIVMELLEGQNLRERLEGRPLGLRRTLEIATQVARGLAVAHEHKLTHRDLKPENIFILPDGQVKILDFGLAKLASPPSGDQDATQEHLTGPNLTQAGTLLGTAGYMSPEQVNGWAVDHRSDIFSFGIILYEMITGQAPFRRPSLVETLHAVLKDDPPEPGPEWRLPPILERTLRRCLEKDPRQRFQTASDLMFHLEGASLPQSASVAGPAPAVRRPLPAWLWKGGLGAAILLLPALAFWLGRQGGTLNPVVFHRLTYRTGVVQGARLSPDGRTFVFGLANGREPTQLMVGRTDGVGARPLGLPPGTQILAISATGEMALKFTKPGEYEGTLAVAPLSGGAAPREIAEHVFGADWGPGGRDLAVLRAGERRQYVLEYPQGHRIYDGPLINPTFLDYPRVSPRGDRVAFLEHLGVGKENLSVVDRQGRRRVLVDGICESLQWAPDGRKIYFTFRHSDDRKELRSVTLSGRQQVLDRVLGRLRIHDITRDGRLLLDQSVEKGILLYRGPADKADRDLSWLHSSNLADLSGDGSQLLLGEADEGGGPGGAYLRKADGTDAIRLGDGDPLTLSPDGKWALVISTDARKVLTILPTGVGTGRLLENEVRADWGAFVAGGRQVLLAGIGPDGAFRAYLQPTGGGPAQPWPGRVSQEAFCLVSPDGERVALGPMAGKVAIFGLDGKLQKELGGIGDGEALIQWHRSGAYLFLADLSVLPAKVYTLDLATGRRKLWREVGPLDPDGVVQIRNLAISQDGRALAYSFTRVLTSDLYLTDPLD